MTDQLKSVMFVDDDPDILSLAKISIDMAGIEFIGCSSGQEALERLSQKPLPQLVVLDVMMPLMDGPTTLTKIREIHSREVLPVFFLTAKARQSSVKQLQDSTGEVVLTKPFSPMTLAQKLQEIWEQQQTLFAE